MNFPPGARARSSPARPLLSIDVEEYFQVVNLEDAVRREDWSSIPSRLDRGLDRVLELLAESGAGATCFVLGSVAERNPASVRRLADAGLEIASHGFDHRRLDQLVPESLDRDLARAEEAIGAATGVHVRGYRAPYFSLGPRTLWALDVLIDRGYTFDSSLFPGRHPAYGMPGAPDRPFAALRRGGRTIAELPVAVAALGRARLGVGGGYFRLYPYALTRYLLRRLERAGAAPFTFYLHPWELDPDQPRLRLPWWRRWRQYQGLRATEPRMRRLLADFRFRSLGSALGELELEAVGLEPAAVRGSGPAAMPARAAGRPHRRATGRARPASVHRLDRG